MDREQEYAGQLAAQMLPALLAGQVLRLAPLTDRGTPAEKMQERTAAVVTLWMHLRDAIVGELAMERLEAETRPDGQSDTIGTPIPSPIPTHQVDLDNF